MPNAGALQKLEKVQNSTIAWFCGQVLDYGQTHEMSTSCGFTYDLEPSTHFQVSPITATRRNRSYIRQDFKNVQKTSLTAPAFPKTWKPTHWKNWNRNSKFPNYGLRAVSRGKIQRKSCLYLVDVVSLATTATFSENLVHISAGTLRLHRNRTGHHNWTAKTRANIRRKSPGFAQETSTIRRTERIQWTWKHCQTFLQKCGKILI